jgi:hypothetical protein
MLQPKLGKALMRARAAEYKRVAETRAAKEGTDFRAELMRVIQEVGDQGFTAYVDPVGKYRLDDGNHRTEACRMLAEEYGLDLSKIRWKVKVKGVYYGERWERFAKAMYKLKKGFPELYVEGAPVPDFWQLGRLFKALPQTYKDAEDSPMRSAVGALFGRLKIKASRFKEYVQFFLGMRFEESGVRIPKGRELDASTTDTLLFLFMTSPELRNSIVDKARSGEKQEIRELMEMARIEFEDYDLGDLTLDPALFSRAPDGLSWCLWTSFLNDLRGGRARK